MKGILLDERIVLKMGNKFRKVYTDFWREPIVLEQMTPEEKYFYGYLLTNENTTDIGIYKITKKQIAFDMGYSVDTIHLIMERFIHQHKLIRYNPLTRELAIKNWGRNHLADSRNQVIDSIISDLKEVEDTTLIQYISESIPRKEIRDLFQSFCAKEEFVPDQESIYHEENDSSINDERKEYDDKSTFRNSISELEEETFDQN
jgi:hypothetical protein